MHGLGGNLRRTWKQIGTDEPWFNKPEFLGDLKDGVRVLSFGYNANRFEDVANTRIIHHANSLLRHLVLKRLDHAVSNDPTPNDDSQSDFKEASSNYFHRP